MVLCISLLGCLERFCPHITTKSKNNGVRSQGFIYIILKASLLQLGIRAWLSFPKESYI